MRTWILPAVLLIWVACSNGSLSPEEEFEELIKAGTGEQPGILEFRGRPIIADVPTTATSGDSLTVTVWTYLARCMQPGGTTTVTHADTLLIIEPFDVVPDIEPGLACNDNLPRAEHKVTVFLDRPRDLTVEFRGRLWPENEPLSRRYTISVR